MPIDLDLRTAIRHPDLGRVVQALLNADAHDEADWIEWKSHLDLSTKMGCFPIARTILGMANRMPATASLACEGLGYIVVGAEPGNLLGVESVDPADLDQLLEPWLGGVEGPRYAPKGVVPAAVDKPGDELARACSIGTTRVGIGRRVHLAARERRAITPATRRAGHRAKRRALRRASR